MSNKVVITGIGIISPFGVGNNLFLKGIKEGKSCIHKISRFDVSSLRSQKAGLILNFDPKIYEKDYRFHRLPRIYQFALISCDEALNSSNMIIDDKSKEETGIFFGTAQGASEHTEFFLSDLIEKGPRFLKPLLFQNTTFSSGSGEISIKYGIHGPNIAFPNGYCSGGTALEMAYYYLKRGKLNCAIIVGADEIAKVSFEALCHLKLLSPLNNDKEICRPFDASRNGIVLGEGACTLILETFQHASNRGAHIFGEILGVGNAHDAYKFTNIDPDGGGMECSIRNALKEAKINEQEIDFISSSANSNYLWDKAETVAIKNVFKDYAYSIPVSSIKSMIGETQGASCGFNIAACLYAFENGFVPPTINYNTLDPECDLNYVPNKYRKSIVNVAVANSYSFGGNAISVVLKNLSS